MKEKFILFTVAGTTYGLRASDVRHVEMVEQITGVPNAAHFVDGVVFSRGEVIPALNLRARFGFDRIPNNLHTRLLVVHSEGRSVGLIVDSAREFVEIAAGDIQPPNRALDGAGGGHIQGTATLETAARETRLILVLDLRGVLNFTESISAA